MVMHRIKSIFDRFFGKAEELTGVVLMHEDLRVAGEILEERGELEAEEADQEES